MSSSHPTPSSILIVGSGVFGLSTAYALARRPEYSNTTITVLDRADFPAPDGSSIDSSRIVRADYADSAYSLLMAESQPHWRGELGADGRYSQVGLAIFMEDGVDDQAQCYMADALNNVVSKLGLKRCRREDGGEVTVIENEATAREVMGTTGGFIGARGYVNWTSGWAHAEEAMKYVRRQAEATGRVTFRTAEVKRLLLRRENQVDGVELTSGEEVKADLTILATGAWTPKLIDLRGRASASGQVLAYIDLTQEEQDRLGTNPVFISETSGMFIIPPIDRVLKVARHGFGYANFCKTACPEKAGEQVTVSLPRTKQDDPDMCIPPEGSAACRNFLQRCIPDLGDRPWSHTRICWYTDTPKGDWIIDHHPQYQGLFIATGGSGHGFKFLPVIGERIIDVIERRDRDDLGEELRQKWKWPATRCVDDHVWTGDWRGGKKGMVLCEEYDR